MSAKHVVRSMDLNLVPWKWMGVVVVTKTRDDYVRYVKRTMGMTIELGSGSIGHAYVEYGKPWLLWLTSRNDAATLAHEALHIAAGVLEARGLKYSRESEEAYTYTMEYIIRSVLTNARWRTARA